MMKKIILAAFILCAISAWAQEGVKFAKTTHSFGKITKDKPVTYVFSFSNTSLKPVIVENATAECGCTTPEYPKEPIMKGKSGSIKVTYNAATVGTFKKNVTIKFANKPAPTVLTIDGEVIEAKEVAKHTAKKKG